MIAPARIARSELLAASAGSDHLAIAAPTQQGRKPSPSGGPWIRNCWPESCRRWMGPVLGGRAPGDGLRRWPVGW